MSESGRNIVEGFRVLRKFCEDVSLMLITANEMMEKCGWTRISSRTAAVQNVDALDNAKWWISDAFFCFYEHTRFPSLLPFIAVLVDDVDGDPSRVTEPLASAGWLDYSGAKAKTEWKRDYDYCYSHLRIEGGRAKDDGTFYKGDERDVWDNNEIRPGAVMITTFAHPLAVITNSETLKAKVVQPLLDGLPR